MRQRWRIVLVDEFQDTDPVQWKVLDRAFSGTATMVLIGDPKQAIYAFRGGDVVTYLEAADDRDRPGTRWPPTGAATRRSSRPCTTRPRAPRWATRGSPCTPSERHHPGSRLAGPGTAPAPRPSAARGRLHDRSRRHRAASTRCVSTSPRDLADDVARLLASGATFEGRPSGPVTSRC